MIDDGVEMQFDLNHQIFTQGYDRLVAFFDGDFSAQDKFTALGSIYMVHRSLPNTDIYNFQEKGFVSLKAGQAVIKVRPLNQKLILLAFSSSSLNNQMVL